jgi:hypothetical protein
VDGPDPSGGETLPAEDHYALLPWRPGFGPRKPRLERLGAPPLWPGQLLAVRARSYHQDGSIRLRYIVNWGDGSVTASDLAKSGVYLELGHAWATPGTYRVICQARDQYGLTSPWSQALLVEV